ncbi:DNA polymerase epsilon [Protomyces lactucae-debilis]|uniref:DNA polymerase epsilon catalytic subunit n=1 Tax=Protomyces lactucae-debilis TaxID=2754530 RepID=A0A1Y2FK92_PROLT|nr:DNA polymerase epsilon [Protomyces lactucae-debilis]ORY84392.1 DNA polymerase epsilon [Protomyces lactucae-debilis]
MGRPSKTFGIPGSAARGGSAASRGRFVKQRPAAPATAGHTDTTTANSTEDKFNAISLASGIDDKFGFTRYEAGPTRQGWLINMHPTLLVDADHATGRAAVDFYFLQDGGDSFRATIPYEPYFLIAVKVNHEAEVEEFLRRKFEGVVRHLSRVQLEDLRMPNHLTGYRRTFIKVTFSNTSDLFETKRFLAPVVEKNKSKMDAMDVYNEVAAQNFYNDDEEALASAKQDPTEAIVDLREYDVPYQVRVAIDKDIRIGKWYDVTAKHGQVSFSVVESRITRADPVIMAYDIETTKLPLKFPDAAVDQIMMISYMIDGEGFLITNREIVAGDIEDFEYTPKPEFKGPFMIFNEPDEKAVIERFFSHIQDAKPTVIVTYNGDFFDWPFVETRALIHGIDMFEEIGFRKNNDDIYQSRYCAHMDAFAWVKRDSYLPQGSQGLKAVTTAKLGYDPIELDPELMTLYASEKPQVLAQYSVSDAVATYYLYMKYCHPFIFSLCNILPLNPDDCLRKGTGTLCEMLLMVNAYSDGIVLPNKYVEEPERFFEGHLLESETYVGGHVESLEAGVFRSDIPEKFEIQPDAIQGLIDDLDRALQFSIEVEAGKSMDDVEDYEDIKAQIKSQLEELRDEPSRNDCPKIYHLDVASMYPNIMTTNRLQPDSIVDESNCATCDFNRPGKTCDKRMTWAWRGEYYPPKRDEYNMIKQTLVSEQFPPRFPMGKPRTFDQLPAQEQMTHITKRLGDFSRKVYHKIKETKTIERTTIVCQRENPFYVNTVKGFRDRRYEYKNHQKTWKRNAEQLAAASASPLEVDDAKKMVILYDSLQLAHKVILNSFYGYVMRKGSRWYSMEMAGVTCLTGATIIQLARQLVEKIGRPLELDTDGIWCILPATFPENFTFKMRNGKPLFISYPCVMLNHLVHDKFTNHQYEDLIDPKSFKYEKHSENSIFFEVDGPYKAMILPTSKEENKNLKKRYAVFNDDGTLAELKGFEVKRRGELKLIKVFQTQVFKVFLEGKDLQECYAAVAKVADKWLDVLYSKGATLGDEELVELVCENRSMSKTIAEYGSLKSTSISTAKRLAEFLGDQMIKDKGLACKYIISAQPKSAPVTERAVPIAIFSAEDSIKRHFLRKWLKDPGLTQFDLRSILDWDYYLDRFGSVIQKLITMPAAMQKISNPVPRVAHPDWLNKQLATALDPFKQSKVTKFFSHQEPVLQAKDANILNHAIPDLDDSSGNAEKRISILTSKRKERSRTSMAEQPEVIQPLPLAGYEGTVEENGHDVCGYTVWLRHQKKKWKAQAAARQRRRQIMGEDEIRRPGVRGGGAIERLRNKAAERIAADHYEILQVHETDEPGVLKAWVLIGQATSSIRLRVPRSFYVNFRDGADVPDINLAGCKMTETVAKLPSGQMSTKMFLVTMSEGTYQGSSKELAALVSHPSVEGIYERQLPLVDRALISLGSQCSFVETRAGALGEAMSNGFALTSLKELDAATKNNYLSSIDFHYIFIMHVVAGPKEMVAFFSSHKSEAVFVSFDTAREQGKANVVRIYREQRQAALEALGDLADKYPNEMAVNNQVHNTEPRYLRAIADAIKTMKAEQPGPHMVVLSTPSEAFLQKVPSLADQPVMRMPGDENLASALDWANAAAKLAVIRYLSARAWLDYRLLLARYGRLPICNLGEDEARTVIDVTMARQLKALDVVLWWSDAPQADQGGRELDDLSKSLETVDSVKVNTPGAYSTVCIELEVRNLIISTMLNSAVINELEGSSADDSFLSIASGDMQDGAFASPSIAAFKALLKDWWREASVGTPEADIMIDSAVRWIKSQDSALYDKNLDLYSQRVSNKAFLQLMAEFRKVGSRVIFGAPGRILIQTTKTHVGTAYAYGQYIVKAIRSKTLFHFIDMQIAEYWDYLLWLDDVNYGGYCTKEVTSEDQEMTVAMQWNVKHYLPKALSDVFEDWVVEYMGDMYDVKRELADTTLTQRANAADQEALEKKMSDVTTKISGPLRKQIQQLALRYKQWQLLDEEDQQQNDTFAMQHKPAGFEPTEAPLLSMVKSLCAVFMLVGEAAQANRVLRRDLLQVLDVREFANKAKFIDPCNSVTLSRHCCQRCSNVQDLQIGRDPAQQLSSMVTEGASRMAPACTRCGATFDMLAVQEALIVHFMSFVAQYQMQDLRCGRCKKIKAGNLATYCVCSGLWTETIKRETVTSRRILLSRLAAGLDMELLEFALRDFGSL